MRQTAWILGTLLLVPLSAFAEPPTLVQAAFARAGESENGWGYTRSEVEHGTTTVERFDPTAAGDGWTLVAIDGEPPSKKQLTKYAAKSETRQARDHPDRIDFGDLVDVDSIALVADSTSSATFRFKPTPDDSGEKDPASDYLDGTMVVDKIGPLVTSLELANADPFSPATGFKINKMRVRMEFGLDPEGRFVIRELSQAVEGRLLGIKRIKQASTVSYGEFTRPN